jgi:chromosome partition protein MukE
MTTGSFKNLEEVISDDQFPKLDLALRRGRHIGRDDSEMYEFLVDAQPVLEPFYQRFGCELIQQSDGYFYLLPRPSNTELRRRQLSRGEMLVGQALAVLYLDPATLQHGGVVAREVLLHRLNGLLSTEVLATTLDGRRFRRGKKLDDRVAAESIRTKVGEALRGLGDLGFIELRDDGSLRLRPALMRFAEPVRGLGDLNLALERLVRSGEVVLGDDGEPDDDGDAGDVDADATGDEESIS